MAGITLEQAQTKLNAYLAAEEAVLTGQSYQIAGRSLTRANLADIQMGITLWDARVKALDVASTGRPRVINMCPGG